LFVSESLLFKLSIRVSFDIFLININKENNSKFIIFSSDTKYIIKSLTKNEYEFFIKILPEYYNHLINCISNNINNNKKKYILLLK